MQDSQITVLQHCKAALNTGKINLYLQITMIVLCNSIKLGSSYLELVVSTLYLI